MNKKDILKILESAKDKNGDVPMRLVRQAFEKLPIECEDAVSRAELLSAFPYDDEPTVTKCSLRMTINHLPSVTPKRKTGKWLDDFNEGYKCSECGAYLEIDCGDTDMDFCPNCGVDMRG